MAVLQLRILEVMEHESIGGITCGSEGKGAVGRQPGMYDP